MMKIATSLSPRDRIWVTLLGKYRDASRCGRRYGRRYDGRRYGRTYGRTYRSVRLTSMTKFPTCLSLRESVRILSGE